jgi:hypothetical protein
LPICAPQVPAMESGVLRPPAHRGWWLVVGISTSTGGLPVLGVRFGGLKSDQQILPIALIAYCLLPGSGFMHVCT